MDPEVIEYLKQESSPFHDRILEFAVNRIRASQNRMSQRYPKFQEAERLLRSFRDPDAEDLEVRANGLTEGVQKIVVPMTYAMIQSILAWQLAFFIERKPPIPVEGVGPRDVLPAIHHEHVLEYQWDNMSTKGILVLLQWFLDSYRYGLGVVFNAWTVREFLGFVRNTMPLAFQGEMIGVDDELREEDVVAYEGNEALNLMPYDWFPDPNVPVGRFQEGEFCGYRNRRSHSSLRVKEAEGLYVGVRFIPDTRQESQRGTSTSTRGAVGGSSWNDSDLATTVGMEGESLQVIDEHGRPYPTLHHLYALVPPKVLRLKSAQPAASGLPRMYVITVANMSRVIRVEAANLPSRKFPFAVIEPNFDLHSPMNPGLVEIMSGPQYHLSWLINSRTANVRRSLNYEVVYDPSLIEEEDLRNPNPAGLIRLKQEAFHSGTSLDQIVKQFPAADVTQSHMVDAAKWIEIMEQISGANRMIQGLSNTGRRAATEVQAQMGLAAGRMKLLAYIQSAQGVTDWVGQCIDNTKAFLTQRLSLRVREPWNKLLNEDYLDVTPDFLQGMFRIPLLEAGIPTDKAFHANVLREVLGMGMQNPQVAQVLATQINYSEIFVQLMRVLGIRNLKDFFLQQAGGGAQPAQIQVQPDEQVARQEEAGNLIPSDGFERPGPETNNGGSMGRMLQ